MAANPSSILLNSLSSVSNVNRGATRNASAESFADQWSQQAASSRSSGAHQRSDSREQQRYSERAGFQAERSEHHSAAKRSNTDQTAQPGAEPAQRRNDKKENVEPPVGPVKTPVQNRERTEPAVNDASKVDANLEANSDQLVPADELSGTAKPISSAERFILGLLGVTVPMDDGLASVDQEALVDEPNGDTPRDFIDLFLIGGAASSADNDLAMPGENTEILAGELNDEDASLAIATDLANEVAELAQVGVKQSSVAVENSPAELKSVSVLGDTKGNGGQRAAVLGFDPKVGEIEVPEAEGDVEGEADEMFISTSKVKDNAGPIGSFLKDASALAMTKDMAPSPSATGYSETAGISQGQSLGRATGLEHNFQLQRGAQIQGRSTMQSDIGQAQWKTEVAEKVAWFSARNISHAEIRLDPPELGSLQIKIQLNQEQAQVTFNSPHASVREALDQSSNRLREMFQEQGLNLADVNVGGGGAHEREARANELATAMTQDEDSELEAQASIAVQRMGLVDSYA